MKTNGKAEKKKVYIDCNDIVCERNCRKGIIIGKQGRCLKDAEADLTSCEVEKIAGIAKSETQNFG